jgi:hypothetical protein
MQSLPLPLKLSSTASNAFFTEDLSFLVLDLNGISFR